MRDQGEIIVNLAQELLEAGPIALPEPASRTPSISFKMFCLATALTALGSCLLTEWAHDNLCPLNRYEKTELNALIFYAARLKGIDENHLRGDIQQPFNVASFDDITQREFIVARRYLQEKAQ